MRTDQNNNPTAFTTDIAKQANLVYAVDYINGSSFVKNGHGFNTAELLGDQINVTIKVIDILGYYTHLGIPRWDYIALPKFIWDSLTYDEKRDVIGFHYKHEGGTAMRNLFPNYEKS